MPLTTVIPNGDGTGTRTLYGPDGQVTGTEQVTGLPVSELPSPPTDAEIDDARASLAAATTVSQMKTRALVLDDLRARQLTALGNPAL